MVLSCFHLPSDGSEDRNAAVIGDADERIDLDRRLRGLSLRIVFLRMIAAPVADVCAIGLQ